MDFLVPLLAADGPSLNFIGQMIQGLYGGISLFGLTIIVFTLILKAITLPIEIWQRSTAFKNAEKMKLMKPMIEKIEKAYGDNKRGAQAEKQKLFKKYKYSMVAGCLPMILTMAIFIFMMTGLSSYTAKANYDQFADRQQVYHSTVFDGFREGFYEKEDGTPLKYKEKYDAFFDGTIPEGKETDYQNADGEWLFWVNSSPVNADGDKLPHLSEDSIRAFFVIPTSPGTEEYLFVPDDFAVLRDRAQEKAAKFAEDNLEGFLWIENIWRPDSWANVFANYDEFSNGQIGMAGVKGADRTEYEHIYEGIDKLNLGYGKAGWNGLLLLPLLSLVTQFFSMRISMSAQSGMKASEMKDSKDPAMQSQKMMMWLMPIMMVAFSLFYTAAFALYIVCNAILSIVSNLAITAVIKARYKKKPIQVVEEVSYRR